MLSQRRKLQGSLKQLGVEHKRKSDTPLKSIASVPSSSAASNFVCGVYVHVGCCIVV